MGEPAVGSIPLTRRFVQVSATVQVQIVSRTRRVPSRYENSGRPVPSVTVIHPSLALLLAVCTRADINGTVRPWILKLERTRRWSADRAAIKAEVKRAKETVDLIGIARAITRLDALEAEIDAVQKTEASKTPS
jgi:hypothetical protein